MGGTGNRCDICGKPIPEYMGICPDCISRYAAADGEAESAVEELRDIAGVLSIEANSDGNIKQAMESILRIADRLEKKEHGETTKVFAKSSIGKVKDGNGL